MYTFLHKLEVYQHYALQLNETVRDMEYQHKILAMADFILNILIVAFWGYDHPYCMHANIYSSLSKQNTTFKKHLLGLCEGSCQCQDTDGYQLCKKMHRGRQVDEAGVCSHKSKSEQRDGQNQKAMKGHRGHRKMYIWGM